VVFAGLPRLLRDILYASVLLQDDLSLVGEAATPGDLERILRQEGADVIVLGDAAPQLPSRYQGLFAVNPRVRILAIVDNGRENLIYELRPHRKALGQCSPSELRRVIRDGVGWSRATVAGE
jgi:hypothetical protein